MNGISCSLVVTGQAAYDALVSRVCMTLRAVRPLAVVSAGIDGEEVGIVLKVILYRSLGMARKARGTLITVAGHAAVNRVYSPLRVAGYTGVLGAVIGINVARDTVIPHSGVVARVDREIGDIVLGIFAAFAGRVAGEAGIAIPGVGCYAAVNRVRFSLSMTDST